MKTLIDQLFIEKAEGNNRYYILNESLPLTFKDEQEAAGFLVEAIRAWKSKGLFLNEVRVPEGSNAADIPEDKLVVTFRYFRGEAAERYFKPVLALQEKILPNLTELGFVEKDVVCGCGCGHISYSYPFQMLELFAKEGREGLLRRENEKRAEKEREALRSQNESLDKKLAGKEITPELREQLLPHSWEKIMVVNSTVALLQGDRSEYGSSGGCGYWSQVYCFCGSQKQMQEWQWRDRYSADNDRKWLCVQDIGKVEVSEKEGKTIVVVELVNKNHGNRSTTFTFDKPTQKAAVTLSIEQQTLFVEKAKRELEQIMNGLNDLMPHKPTMIVSRGPDSYYKPTVKQSEVRPKLGVAAFVVEEQIDHHGDDRQMRCNLYVLKWGQEKAERKAEDHGYNTREGGAFLQVLEVETDRVVINTKSGKSTIQL